MRDFTAIKRIATAYMKLLFPHWVEEKDVNLEEFDTYCLQPAIIAWPPPFIPATIIRPQKPSGFRVLLKILLKSPI